MSCVIFGAGKIARGFIGHLLWLSEIPFVFVEKSEALAALINERGSYTVNVLGAPDKNCTVRNVRAISFSNTEAITDAIAHAEVVFDAVGGKNLGELVPFYARGIERRAEIGGDINFITCENWKKPAEILRDGVSAVIKPSACDFFEQHVGMTESVVMRSAIEAEASQIEKDPLVVNVQDYWTLPVDASRIKGTLPKIRGLDPIDAFGGFLERKFYTYNAANGTVSYLGALLGYRYIADAAHDPFILSVLEGVYRETAHALSRKHAFPLEDQLAFTLTSKKKLQDYTIVDYVERNARDPIRKLGPDDRLVGSALLVESFGIQPENLAVAIAAAIYYDNPSDEYAVQLKNLRESGGVDAVLRNVCRLDPKSSLAALIREKITFLKQKGYLK